MTRACTGRYLQERDAENKQYVLCENNSGYGDPGGR